METKIWSTWVLEALGRAGRASINWLGNVTSVVRVGLQKLQSFLEQCKLSENEHGESEGRRFKKSRCRCDLMTLED